MKRLWAAIAAIAMTIPLALLAMSAAQGAELTPTGSTAVDDLRTCLASNDVLNVYYIVDSSQSLRVEDDGVTPGSDPDAVRADILGSSLAQLGSLEAKTVNWGAGFFSTGFEHAIDWRAWSDTGAEELESAIRAKQPAGWTNWLAAMEGTRQQLALQPDAGRACQLVVWFTDGAIDLQEGDQATADAVNDLCGRPIAVDPPGHPPAQGYGLLNAFRQSGVVVMGTLLAQGSTRADAEVMWPLVEGSGDYRGRPVECGQPDPPEGAVRGAVVDASDPDALARVFLELASQIAGGYPEPLDPEGRFWVDDGVSRFQIVLGTGAWSLTAPTESGLGTLTAGTTWPSAEVTESVGAIRLEVDTRDPASHGQWHLEAGDVRDVFLFSDLSIVFDEKSSIELGADGAADATLTAQVEGPDGEPGRLDVYGTAEFTAWIVDADGARQGLPGAEVDTSTGEITIPLPPDVSAAEIVVTASLDPIETQPNRLTLAPVTTQQRIETVLPANFPRIETVPVKLDPLEGADGRARGAIIVHGPRSGGDGRICLPEDPTVSSDSADRAATWEWDVTADLDADRCAVLPEGAEDVHLRVAASNAVAADSLVRASIPVEYSSADGEQLTQSVPIEFRSTHPVNPLAVGLLALLLLALGILVPLVLLWLVNWWTTRLDIDNGIQRARFTVRIGPAGVAFADTPATDSALAERFQYRPPQRNVRSIDDPDLGRLAAHVPWFPLAEPTYRITPRTGTSIIGARTSARAASAGLRRDDGSMEFRQLPLDAFWAVSVSNADLARGQRGDEVNGTAVLYHRMDPSQQDQYRARLDDIGLEGSLTDAVDRARAGLAEAQAKRNAKRPSTGGVAPRPTGESTPGAPPRGSESSPPPRDGAPPPRGGTVPPPRPGASGPPPRPGASGPPPLPGSPPPRPGNPPPRGR